MNFAVSNCRFFITGGNVKGTKSCSIPRSQEQLEVQATTKIILWIVNGTILIRKSLAVNEEGPLRWHCYTSASEADFRVKKYFTSSCSIDKMPCFRKSGTISYTLNLHVFPFSFQDVILFYGALTLYSCTYVICASAPFSCYSLGSL